MLHCGLPIIVKQHSMLVMILVIYISRLNRGPVTLMLDSRKEF